VTLFPFSKTEEALDDFPFGVSVEVAFPLSFGSGSKAPDLRILFPLYTAFVRVGLATFLFSFHTSCMVMLRGFLFSLGVSGVPFLFPPPPIKGASHAAFPFELPFSFM